MVSFHLATATFDTPNVGKPSVMFAIFIRRIDGKSNERISQGSLRST